MNDSGERPTMIHPADAKRVERARAFARNARTLTDGDLEARHAEAARESADLRARLEEATAWCEALATEKDRRVIQRKAGEG